MNIIYYLIASGGLLLFAVVLLWITNNKPGFIPDFPKTILQAPRKVAIAAVRKVKKKNYVGTGEFAEAFLIKNGEDILVKRNRSESYHNPDFWRGKDFHKRSKRIMKGEFRTFKQLKGSPIMPEWMHQFTDRGGRYYLMRESGEIPLEPGQERVFLPKWKKGSVKQKDFDKFTQEIFEIARDQGRFEDNLQVAKREDGSLFIYDLGFFRPLGGKEDLAEYRWRDTSDIDFFRFWSYKQTHMYMERLKGQLGVEYFVPKFVTDYNIKHYQALAEERKAMGMTKMAKEYQEDVDYWKKQARRREQHFQKIRK